MAVFSVTHRAVRDEMNIGGFKVKSNNMTGSKFASTRGFTLVELIVSMMLALIVVGIATGFIISGSNFLSHAQKNGDEHEIATSISDFVKEQLLLAEDITVVESNVPPVISGDDAVIYIGDASGLNTANTGYLWFQRPDDTSPVNAYGKDYYNNNTISLDYKVTVTEGKPKYFEIKITTVDRRGQPGYSVKKTFKLVNSDMSRNPKASGSISSTNKRYYILLTRFSKFPKNPIFADGDDPANRVVEWKVPATGKYQIETWGADGGNGHINSVLFGTYKGGTGGYASGIVRLKKGTIIYLTAGGKGRDKGIETDGLIADSFNGGGLSYSTSTSTSWSRSGEGGGASDVRIGTDSLLARLIVAGGGGGAGLYDFGSSYTTSNGNGGNGGGSSGMAGNYNQNTAGGGGTLSAGGSSGSGYTLPSGFGIGAASTTASSNAGGAGGGGGWYGGGASARGNSLHTSGGGGGSGYVLTTDSYKPGGYLLGSEYNMTDTVNVQPTDAKFVNKPTTGHGGYVLITPIGPK
jgi:prepilin-type N-terminal cleavage/methylation domain-containing protein